MHGNWRPARCFMAFLLFSPFCSNVQTVRTVAHRVWTCLQPPSTSYGQLERLFFLFFSRSTSVWGETFSSSPQLKIRQSSPTAFREQQVGWNRRPKNALISKQAPCQTLDPPNGTFYCWFSIIFYFTALNRISVEVEGAYGASRLHVSPEQGCPIGESHSNLPGFFPLVL